MLFFDFFIRFILFLLFNRVILLIFFSLVNFFHKRNCVFCVFPQYGSFYDNFTAKVTPSARKKEKMRNICLLFVRLMVNCS